MCPGLGEWSLHKGILKGVLNLRNLVIYPQIVSMVPCRHLVLCKVASKTTSIFIRADILVLVSEFLVVVILSEWWSVLTTALPLWAHPC